ncbi:hypothetical protein [Roseicella aquatilis]|nr:hypothetical protein [Roseicella aquatilis]
MDRSSQVPCTCASHLAYVWVERPCIQLGKVPLWARRGWVLAETASNPG